MDNVEENREMIWKLWKKSQLNSEKIWKMLNKSPLNSEKIWKIQKKSKLNREKYGTCGRKVSWIVKRFGKYRRILWNEVENMEEK
jgi:hypothetical protein